MFKRLLHIKIRPNFKSKIDFRKVPKLDSGDITESVARGDGPGGQSVSKSSNAVRLKHTPTGVAVRCHETRSLEQNRKIAHQKLISAVDNFINKEESVEAQVKR